MVHKSTLFIPLFIFLSACATATAVPTQLPTPITQATQTQNAANIPVTPTASVPTATSTATSTVAPLPTDTPKPTNAPSPTITASATALPPSPNLFPTSAPAQKRLVPEIVLVSPSKDTFFNEIVGISIADSATSQPSELFRLTPKEASSFFDGFRSAVWSSDGKRILLALRILDDQNQEVGLLRTIDPDGRNQIEIFRTLGLGDVSNAIWSQDNSRIAFRAHVSEEGQACTFVINSNGTGRRRVNLCEYQDYPLYWSSNGKWLIVVYAGTDARLGNTRAAGFFALAVDGNERVPLDSLQGIDFLDQTYFPWRTTDNPCVLKPHEFSLWGCR